MKKALIITYYWPPAGGPGVQRMLKFAKYMPQFGWEPVVLTVKDGEYPAIDQSLLNEVKDVPVFRVKSNDLSAIYKKMTGDKNEAVPVAVLSQKEKSPFKRFAKFIRLNFVLPDAKIGWKRPAIRMGKKIIKEFQPDVILSSSPPPTVHLIAKILSKHSKTPWIADLRDPWSKIHYYQNNRSAFTNYLDQRLEKRTLEKADKVITVSRHFGSLIDAKKQALHILPNGFDEEDFAKRDIVNSREHFTIAYVGGINENRFYPELFESIRQFAIEKINNTKSVRFILAGKIPQNYLEEISTLLGASVEMDIRGYVSHAEAINIMMAADVLLMMMEKVADYCGHVPGKLFEYIASGRFTLGAGPTNGDAQEILNRAGAGKIADNPDDYMAILCDCYEKWKNGKLKGASQSTGERYSRRNLTKQLVDIFEGRL